MYSGGDGRMNRTDRGSQWIRHSHYLDPDEYECPRCGQVFQQKTSACPHCGAALRGTKDDQGWIEEAEEISLILGDD